MKKMIKSLVISLALIGLVVGTSFAYEHHRSSFGTFAVDSDSYGDGADYGYVVLPGQSGAAGGIGGVIGSADASADGYVFNGEVGGNVGTTAGGFTNTQEYIFNPGIGDMSIGNGSRTDTFSTTSAYADINVDPGYFGFGAADAEISGFTAMGSLNGSIVGNSPMSGWTTDGYSDGIAAQGAVGGFEGGAYVESGSDYNTPGHYTGNWWSGYHWVPGHYVDSNAGASVNAGITMTGFSYSDSYRYIDNNGSFHTEGMGTVTGAETHVTSYGNTSSYDNGWSDADADVYGSYVAIGGAATQSFQSNPNGTTQATAIGGYVGGGTLNTTFDGTAHGYTSTSMTTLAGSNGVVSSSAAGMQVSAQTGYNSQQ